METVFLKCFVCVFKLISLLDYDQVILFIELQQDLGEDTEVYETLESSPKIDVSPSSRKKKLSFVLESDSKEDYTADAG